MTSSNNFPTVSMNKQTLNFFIGDCSTSQETQIINHVTSVVPDVVIHEEKTEKRKGRISKYDVSHMPHLFGEHGDYASGAQGKGERNYPITADPSLDLKCQKSRTVFTDEHMVILEAAYMNQDHADADRRTMVSELCGLSEERVRIWYQNRRAKEKRQVEDDLAILAQKNAESNIANSSNNTMEEINETVNRIFDKGGKESVKTCESMIKSILKKENNAHEQKDVGIPNQDFDKILKSDQDLEKKKRARGTNQKIQADSNQLSKISEEDIVKSIIRGEEMPSAKTVKSEALSPMRSFLPSHVKKDMLHVKRDLPHAKKEGRKVGPSKKKTRISAEEDYVRNIIKGNNSQSDSQNNSAPRNSKHPPKNQKAAPPSGPENTFQPPPSGFPGQQPPLLPGQQPWFNDNRWETDTPVPQPCLPDKEMSRNEVNEMLRYQQNMITYYQKLIMGGQIYPWQTSNPFLGGGTAVPAGENAMQKMLNIPNHPVPNSGYHSAAGSQKQPAQMGHQHPFPMQIRQPFPMLSPQPYQMHAQQQQAMQMQAQQQFMQMQAQQMAQMQQAQQCYQTQFQLPQMQQPGQHQIQDYQTDRVEEEESATQIEDVQQYSDRETLDIVRAESMEVESATQIEDVQRSSDNRETLNIVRAEMEVIASSQTMEGDQQQLTNDNESSLATPENTVNGECLEETDSVPSLNSSLLVIDQSINNA